MYWNFAGMGSQFRIVNLEWASQRQWLESASKYVLCLRKTSLSQNGAQFKVNESQNTVARFYSNLEKSGTV